MNRHGHRRVFWVTTREDFPDILVCRCALRTHLKVKCNFTLDLKERSVLAIAASQADIGYQTADPKRQADFRKPPDTYKFRAHFLWSFRRILNIFLQSKACVFKNMEFRTGSHRTLTVFALPCDSILFMHTKHTTSFSILTVRITVLVSLYILRCSVKVA